MPLTEIKGKIGQTQIFFFFLIIVGFMQQKKGIKYIVTRERKERKQPFYMERIKY